MAKSHARKTKTKAPQRARKKSRAKAQPKVKPKAKALSGRKSARPAKSPRGAAHTAASRSAAPRSAKWVYAFGGGKAEGRADMRNLLGGKGAGLAEMANLGLPVPPGFTITTEVCTHFYRNGRTYPPDLDEQVAAALAKVEKAL